MLFTVIPFILGVVIYNANFGGRIETAEALHYDISEFPGLEREQIDISSDNDVKLGAWIYSNNTLDKPKALIVTLHGMGIGGHNTEMNVIDHFAKMGISFWLLMLPVQMIQRVRQEDYDSRHKEVFRQTL